jgi:hypothetical protein
MVGSCLNSFDILATEGGGAPCAKRSRSDVFAKAVHVTAVLDALAAATDTSLELGLARSTRRMLRREAW